MGSHGLEPISVKIISLISQKNKLARQSNVHDFLHSWRSAANQFQTMDSGGLEVRYSTQAAPMSSIGFRPARLFLHGLPQS